MVNKCSVMVQELSQSLLFVVNRPHVARTLNQTSRVSTAVCAAVWNRRGQWETETAAVQRGDGADGEDG